MPSDPGMIDIETLIREVRRRPAVWNQKSKEYHHNRDHTMQMWQEIGTALGVKSEAAKTKWKHLRDNFRTELKKSIVATEEGENGKYRSGWVWYDALYFLKDVVIPKKTRESLGIEVGESDSLTANEETTSIKEEPRTMDYFPEEEGTTSETTYDTSYSALPNCVTTMTATNRASRKRPRDVDSELLDLEMKKYQLMVNHLDQREQDETYHFLMSLMTPIKSLSLDRQMFIRIKVQELILQEIMQAQGQAGHYPEAVEMGSPPHKNNESS